jgi:hypothetical protein
MDPCRSHTFARVVALTVAMTGAASLGSSAFAAPPDANTHPADAQAITARVELAVESLPEGTQAELEVELARQLGAMADELGFMVAESEAAVVILRVEFGQPDPSKPIYIVNAVTLHNGQLLERADARTCFRCTPAELAARGLELLPGAVAKAVASPPEPIAEPVPPPTVDAKDVAAQDLPRALRPGPTTYVGVSIGVLGLASAITGGILLERGIVRDKAKDPLYLDVVNYEAPGAALLGVGLASMVAGTVLLVVDGWVLAPRRAGRSRAGLSHMSVTANGFALAGRF